jgi:hypothetical protein
MTRQHLVAMIRRAEMMWVPTMIFMRVEIMVRIESVLTVTVGLRVPRVASLLLTPVMGLHRVAIVVRVAPMLRV